jgi:glycosyltransferase involved in cell wall biosynthesis
MTVYNSEKYLAEAIESILAQTYTDFNFLIIDDASTDRSPQIVAEFALRDPRIQYEILPQNRGIGLNRSALLQRSTGEYIAIMDSDDISMPERLALQITYLDEHRECAVVGGSNLIINEIGETLGERKYSARATKQSILCKSPVSQPSVLFRRMEILDVGGYSASKNLAEDYDLWLRVFANGYEISNLSQVILKYRITELQSKSKKIRETLRETLLCQRKAYAEYGYTLNWYSALYHIALCILYLLPGRYILWLFKKTIFHASN